MSNWTLRLSSVAAASVLIVGVASGLSIEASAKGEPEASKCDKFKKGSKEWRKCAGQLKDEPSDNDLYYTGYWLSRTGEYRQALTYLEAATTKDERILTYIGFANRKLGNHEIAMSYYAKALAMNPAYTVARAYLGEAMLQQGQIAAAREQLVAIEGICGSTCADYKELERQIEKVETKG